MGRVRHVALAGIGLWVTLLPVTAFAQPSVVQCSAAFHQALEPIRTGRGVTLGNLHRALRTADSELPGRWQFAHQLFIKGKAPPPPKPERVCVDQRDVNGKARCFRFEMKPPPPSPVEVAVKLQNTPEELRLLRLTHDFVEAKGALPDVGNNGKYNFLVQRVAQDIRLYASQPPHPALCSGASELLEFYGSQLAPVKRRKDEVAMAAKQLKDLASARVRAVAVAEMSVHNRAVAEASKAAVDAARVLAEMAGKAAAAALLPKVDGAAVVALAPIVMPVPRVVPAKPADAAELADFAVVSVPALIGEALRPVLPATIVAEIVAQPTPLASLIKARAALVDPANNANAVPLDVREASFMALRLIEGRIYAERYVSRYMELEASLFGSLADVQAAQTKACVCQE